MSITKEVVNPNLSERLHEAGIRAKSLRIWGFYAATREWRLQLRNGNMIFRNAIAAYTLRELGEMIPFCFFSGQPVIKISNNRWEMKWYQGNKMTFETEVDARAAFLLSLLNEKEVTSDQINGIVTVIDSPVLIAQETPDPNGDNLENISEVKS